VPDYTAPAQLDAEVACPWPSARSQVSGHDRVVGTRRLAMTAAGDEETHRAGRARAPDTWPVSATDARNPSHGGVYDARLRPISGMIG
jgi:hypothetical protein